MNMPDRGMLRTVAILTCLATPAAAGSWTGKASFYSSGSRTASGARFHPGGMTAAHRTLPFGTRVKVTNLENGISTLLTINDRGPFMGGRVIDVTTRAAKVLGFLARGVVRVRVETVFRRN